jgi:hypothetical protein
MSVSIGGNMATTSNYRIPVQTIREANICAEACWYGINFKNLKVNQLISDESLMKYFAEPMYLHGKNQVTFNPDIFADNVSKLITACGLGMLRLGMHRISINAAIATIKNQIHDQFDRVRTTSIRQTRSQSSNAISHLSSGMVTQPNYHQIILASRILFFNVPNIRIYNISSALARNLHLRGRPVVYHHLFRAKMDKCLSHNRTQLSKFSLPQLSHLDRRVWDQIKQTDWWQRRVLDLALLIHFGCAKPNPNITQRVMQERVRRLNLQVP